MVVFKLPREGDKDLCFRGELIALVRDGVHHGELGRVYTLYLTEAGQWVLAMVRTARFSNEMDIYQAFFYQDPEALVNSIRAGEHSIAPLDALARELFNSAGEKYPEFITAMEEWIE